MAERLLDGPARAASRLRRGVTSALAAAILVCTGTVWAAGADASTNPTGSELTVVPLAGTTLWVNGRPYAGQVVLAPDGSGLAVVNRVGFEDYVEGIGEMPSSWPVAALQAQAVAARTYAMWTVLTHAAGPGGGQICASDSCQVYSGLSKVEGAGGASWVAAVRATSGEILTYQSRVIEAVYGSSDGGRTVSGGVAWLPSVSDPEDALAPEHTWTWSSSLTTFAHVFSVPAGENLVSLVSSPTSITESLRSASGAISTTSVAPAAFHRIVNSEMSTPTGLDLPLPSLRYSVSTYGSDVRISGIGDGQGMGLSQYGALGKAEKGWSSAQILGSYYPGTYETRLPASEQPSTIAVTLDDPVSAATVQATGPVQITGADGRVIGSTTGAQGWTARPSASGVELEAGLPGPPASALPAGTSLPDPMSAPTPTQTGPAPTMPASKPAPATATPQPPTAAPLSSPADRSSASVAAAYAAGPASGRRPVGWALAALALLLTVVTAYVRVAHNRNGLISVIALRPHGAHYRGRTVSRRPTASG